jgi:hypothetical protein
VSGAAGFDWQFVVVTLAAVWGGWMLLRPLWRSRGDRKTATGACGRCSSAACTSKPGPAASTRLVGIGSGGLRQPKRSGSLPPGGQP